MKKTIILSLIAMLGSNTIKANERIYVNSDVTTHIVMPERIKMVDISTTRIIGNQCADNMVRIKPYLPTDTLADFSQKRKQEGDL